MSKTVLITGGSSDIGFELAKLFAADRYNLILVANKKDKLEKAASELQKDTIHILTIAKDLSDPKAPQEIYNEVQDKKIQVDILINNAGFATNGYFTETNAEEELNELQVNIVALTHLTKLFSRDMLTRKTGQILNVASTAAFLPGPLMAVYYASKAYVLSFSEALAEEFRGSGVSVSVLCPGPTDTGFIKRAHVENTKIFQGRKTTPEFVASTAYDRFMKNEVVIIPGFRNRLTVTALRFLPRSMVTKFVKSVQEK